MTRKYPPKKRPAPKPPVVQVSNHESFFLANASISFKDRLRLLVHGRLIVAGEINRSDVMLSEITVAIPTLEGVVAQRPRLLSFATYRAKPA